MAADYTESQLIQVSVSETVLERLISSGALCAADLHCENPRAKGSLMGICKRCSAKPQRKTAA